MTLKAQTNAFPPISLPEQSWAQNIRASLRLLAPGPGARSGLKLGVPESGLLPTLTDGYLVDGDNVAGPYGSRLIPAIAPDSFLNLYFGLSGMYYAPSPATERDVLVGAVAAGAENVLHVAQPMNYGAGRLGIRGQVALEHCVKGGDVAAIALPLPDTGLEFARLTYAHARVSAPTTAGAAAGDNFVLKAASGGTELTLATITGTQTGTANHAVRYIPDAAAAATWDAAEPVTVLYSQADDGGNIEGGVVEFHLLLDLF